MLIKVLMGVLPLHVAGALKRAMKGDGTINLTIIGEIVGFFRDFCVSIFQIMCKISSASRVVSDLIASASSLRTASSTLWVISPRQTSKPMRKG